MRARLLLAVVLTGVAACQLVLLGDLEVKWSQDASCSSYGIAEWEVTADGADTVPPAIFKCNSSSSITNSSGTHFFGIAEGRYKVTVRALDSSGKTLASKSESGVLVTSDPGHTTIAGPNGFAFTSSDFTGQPTDCGNGICEDAKGETCTSCPKDCDSCSDKAKLNVYWNINGTIDGTAKSDSWDKCDEVSAAYAAVTFDGTTHYLPCNQNNMTGLVNVSEGSHTIKVGLADSSKKLITSETPDKTLSCTVATPCELVVDFYWDSFLTIKNTMKGDFWFSTSFDGGKACSAVTPQVTTQTSLLYLSGSAVNPAPDVCGPNDVCYPADGTSAGECWGPTQTQKIKDVPWGEYQLAVRGLINGGNICYEAKDAKTSSKKVDILIGAGTVNPLVKFDLARDLASPACE